MGSSAWRTFGFVVGSKATSSVRGVSEMDRLGRKKRDLRGFGSWILGTNAIVMKKAAGGKKSEKQGPLS